MKKSVVVLIISKNYFCGGAGAEAEAGVEAKRYNKGQVANTSCDIWVLFVKVGVLF